MFRAAVKSPTAVATAAAAATVQLKRGYPYSFPSLSPPPCRFYATEGSSVDPVAFQMINYAVTHARSLKSDDSYAQAQLVLDQCLSAHQNDDSGGIALLTMSTLLYERGKYDEAIERLKEIQEISNTSLAVKVSALEALAGLHLELGQDDTTSVLADTCLQLLKDAGIDANEVLHARAKAVKCLTELVSGNLELGDLFSQGSRDKTSCLGNAALSYGEFLHAKKEFSKAKELYWNLIQGISENKDSSDTYALGACNMSLKEVLLAANCALGQLEVHLGNFEDAQEILTRALTKTEEHFGSHHPKVGIILTSVALMYKHKARLERSSSLVIQEGLYRRAIELLKAPPLDIESAQDEINRQEIVALARGGYAEVLCVQQNRKSEGERLKSWAESAWRNRRLSLAEALEFADSTVPAVIDTRIGRAL